MALTVSLMPRSALAQSAGGLAGHVTWRNGGATGTSQEGFHRISVIPVGQTRPVRQLVVDSAPPV